MEKIDRGSRIDENMRLVIRRIIGPVAFRPPQRRARSGPFSISWLVRLASLPMTADDPEGTFVSPETGRSNRLVCADTKGV